MSFSFNTYSIFSDKFVSEISLVFLTTLSTMKSLYSCSIPSLSASVKFRFRYAFSFRISWTIFLLDFSIEWETVLDGFYLSFSIPFMLQGVYELKSIYGFMKSLQSFEHLCFLKKFNIPKIPISLGPNLLALSEINAGSVSL